MGTLYIVSTPIGNLDDITIRAIKTLFAVDVIACEDTRRSGILLQELLRRFGEQMDQDPQWKPKLISYYDEIENNALPNLISLLEDNQDVALISDAGTPLISDPGFRLVRECVKRHISVISVPGPSSVLTALTSSGLPANKFSFVGYLPDKHAQMVKTLTEIRQASTIHPMTFVFYCAPHKLPKTLDAFYETFGNTEITVARELTKVHEEIWSGSISEAKQKFADPKGEIVLLIHLT